jgi:4-diphosphocytidyl-2-C-methyl-D-erythritol kinase
MALALPLGADVPFFVGGDNAFVEGIGERLTPIQLPQAHYMVVKPAASLPTSDIFSHPALIRDTEAVILFGLPEKNTHSTESTAFDGWDRESEGLRNLRSLRNLQGSQRWQPGHDAFGRNDLQPAAEDRCPEVAQVVRWLDSRFGNSRMTGSGSAVFARVAMGSELAVAGLAADDFDLPPAWVGRLCRSLGQHPLKGWVS